MMSYTIGSATCITFGFGGQIAARIIVHPCAFNTAVSLSVMTLKSRKSICRSGKPPVSNQRGKRQFCQNFLRHDCSCADVFGLSICGCIIDEFDCTPTRISL